MKVVTAGQMRELEQQAAGIGMPPEMLMENAGLAVAQEIKRWLGEVNLRPILILVGPGNNGGDGLVAARHLHDWGNRVHLYLLSPRSDSDPNYRLTQQRGISSTLASQDTEMAILDNLLSSAEVVLDAVFGTGKTRPLEGTFKYTLERVSREKEQRPNLQIIALDLPSGLNADTGTADPASLYADLTITMACPKLGLFTFPGAERVGKLLAVDIGIPPSLSEEIPTELITAETVGLLLPRRPLNANKGTFGKVLVAAGSINYIGAVYLACTAALRVGAGLVTLSTAHSLQPILASKLTEVTYAPLPEAEPGIIAAGATEVLQQWLPNYNVLLLGCGLGQNPQVVEFITSILFSLPTPSPALVLDADALNTLAGIPQWWQKLNREAVLTPHPGEMSRLTGLSIEEVQSDRLKIATTAAAQWQKVVILKGAHTIVAAPDGKAKIYPIANPGLASAGTGDVLAGAIAGLLAQGLPPFEAAVGGVFLHAQAGERVREEMGDAGMIASDLLPALPMVMKELKREGR